MNFNQIYETAISQIEANRQREVELAKQKATQVQIIPFNQDIDNSLRNAIAELQKKHSEKIAQMQQDFEAEKQALADAASRKKAAFAETTISAAVSVINAEADAAVSKLRELVVEGA